MKSAQASREIEVSADVGASAGGPGDVAFKADRWLVEWPVCSIEITCKKRCPAPDELSELTR